MSILAFLASAFLLSLLPAEAARSKYPPKSGILNPIFGPREVSGLLDGSVTVKCFYPQTTVNKHDRKYWCREATRSCHTVVSSNGYVAPGYQGRVAITDFPDQGVFLVNVSGLGLADRGSYHCGLGLNNRALSFQVKLDVSEGPNVPEEAELFYVELQGSVTITCSFGQDYASIRKYLCKMEKSGCRNIIDTYGKVDDEYAGRILLSNENTAGSYSIMITQLGWQDAGLYLCGAGVYGESGETKEVDLHVYEGTDVPQGKHTVLGVKGGSVTIECRYDTKGRSSLKYWCKWRKNGCSRIIDSNGFVSDLYEGRVAMYDNPENNTLTVILNRLADSDSGYYWCMTNENREKKTSKELKIVDGEPSLTGEEEVEASVGAPAQLACSYPCKYYSYEKYWCKWTRSGCTPVEASDQSRAELNVDCDKDNKTILLNFDDVALTDQGWYWCGVKHKGVYGETKAVQLRVSGERLAVESGAAARPELLDVDARSSSSSGGSAQDGGGVAQDRASSSGAQSPAVAGSAGPSSLVLALVSVGGVFLILATVFAVYKYRQMKRSDLVSVGSYRTNISMSDFESAKEYGANDNACMKGTQETQIGGDELVSTTSEAESAAEARKAKRSSKEEADVAYSAFLLQASAVAQGRGAGGDTAAPPGPWDGRM
ncbi:polymeric immunoglobulin receptor [Nothoprocta perdicaria]|uniref:polymeric immunoglobulin receptor n=1 Tax=Nothoprocta perdicaria TaxID=30464 RepID=UPI000E1BFB56|nr:polymeric immunoglobulin receptor [Nothoprocta perdicaria]